MVGEAVVAGVVMPAVVPAVVVAALADLAAVAGVALLCGVWVLVQQWVARRDPCQPGVEGNCGCKGWKGEGGGSCKRKRVAGEGVAAGDEHHAHLVQFPTRH